MKNEGFFRWVRAGEGVDQTLVNRRNVAAAGNDKVNTSEEGGLRTSKICPAVI